MKYDVFISYSHRDNLVPEGKRHGWVDRFHKALSQNLTEFLGRTPSIFRDNKIEGYQKILTTVDEGLAESLIFVPILSPNFLTSQWCPKELKYFCENTMKAPGSAAQVFSVVKIPISKTPVEIAENLLKYQFFTEDETNDELVIFNPDYSVDLETKFYLKISDLARKMAEYILASESNTRGSLQNLDENRRLDPDLKYIYLGEPSPDLWEQYNDIKRDLEQRGIKFLPEDLTSDTPRPLAAEAYCQIVREDIEKCNLVINLIGRRTNGYPKASELSYQQLQMKIAGNRDGAPDYKRLIWLPKDIEGEDDEQRTFIEDVRSSSAKGVEFLQNSLEEFKTNIQDALKPPPPAPPSDDQPWVYVLYDKSDIEASRQVEDLLQSKNYPVFPTRAYLEPALAGGPQINIYEEHQQWLARCDAVLIYWNLAPATWVINNVFELQKAKANRNGRNFRSQAVFCEPEQEAGKKVDLIPRTGRLLRLKGFNDLPSFLSELEAQPS